MVAQERQAGRIIDPAFLLCRPSPANRFPAAPAPLQILAAVRRSALASRLLTHSQDDHSHWKCPAMSLTPFQDGAAGVRARYSPMLVLDRPRAGPRIMRRRRKIPSWIGWALLVLTADVVMALLAWLAVGFAVH